MKRLNLKVILLLSVFVAGCAQNPQPLGKPLPTLTYENLQPYSPWNGAVDIRQSFRPNARAVATGKEFKTPPDELLQRYAQRRFTTGAQPVKLIFDIRDATVIKKTEEENMIAFLAGTSEDTYVLSYSILMYPVDAAGKQSDPYKINLKRELFIPLRSSLSEREYRQFEFLEKAIHDIDKIIGEMYEARMR